MLPVLAVLALSCGSGDQPGTTEAGSDQEALTATAVSDLDQAQLPVDVLITRRVILQDVPGRNVDPFALPALHEQPTDDPAPPIIPDFPTPQPMSSLPSRMVWRGEQGLVTQRQGGWYLVEITTDLKGWAPKEALRVVQLPDHKRIEIVTILKNKELLSAPAGVGSGVEAGLGTILFSYREEEGYRELESAAGDFGWLPILHTSKDEGDINLAIAMSRANTLKELGRNNEVYTLVDAMPTNLSRRLLYKALKEVAGHEEILATMTADQAVANNFLETPILRYVSSGEPAPLFRRPSHTAPRGTLVDPGTVLATGRRGPFVQTVTGPDEMIFVDTLHGRGWMLVSDLQELAFPFYARVEERLQPRFRSCPGVAPTISPGDEVMVTGMSSEYVYVRAPCGSATDAMAFGRQEVQVMDASIRGAHIKHAGPESWTCRQRLESLPESVQIALMPNWPREPFACDAIHVEPADELFPGSTPAWRVTRPAGWPSQGLTGFVQSQAHLATDHPERFRAVVQAPEYTLAQREHVSWEGEGELALFRITTSPPALERVFLENWPPPRSAEGVVTWAVDAQGVVTSSAGERCTYDEDAGAYTCEGG